MSQNAYMPFEAVEIDDFLFTSALHDWYGDEPCYVIGSKYHAQLATLIDALAKVVLDYEG